MDVNLSIGAEGTASACMFRGSVLQTMTVPKANYNILQKRYLPDTIPTYVQNEHWAKYQLHEARCAHMQTECCSCCNFLLLPPGILSSGTAKKNHGDALLEAL